MSGDSHGYVMRKRHAGNCALSTSIGTYPIRQSVYRAPCFIAVALSMCDRFSLLLLEFGEVYLEDFGVIYYPAAPTEAETIER